jgi:hypothetical protein
MTSTAGSRSGDRCRFDVFDRPDVFFDRPESRVLPRVLCYFDDIVGEDHVLQNDYVGELLAIREFNLDRTECKILPVSGLAAKRVLPADWNESMLAMRRFDHANYDTCAGPPKHEQQLAL